VGDRPGAHHARREGVLDHPRLRPAGADQDLLTHRHAKPLATLPAGTVAIAGVAWAQTTGIASVEVSIDGGDWQPAELAGEAGLDTWRQWVLRWDALPAATASPCGATDKAGVVQTATRRPIYPTAPPASRSCS
jgi:hypothetical protein